MTTPLPQAFPGADGSAWPAEWDVRIYPNATTFTQQGGKGRITAPGQYDNATMLLSGSSTDFDVTVEFGLASTGDWLLDIVFRATAGGSSRLPSNCYVLGIRGKGAGSSVRLTNIVAGTSATLGDVVMALPVLPARGMARIKATGSLLQAKLWTVGNAEPAAWLHEVTDASHAAGRFGVSVFRGADSGTYAEIDDLVAYVVGGNLAPTANAGVDQAVSTGATVTLTGSGADSDGTIASYAWTLTGKPTGSVAALSGTGATRTFTADLAGSYVASLVVTDEDGATSPADTVTVTATAASSGGTGPVVYVRNAADTAWEKRKWQVRNDADNAWIWE